MTSQFITLNYGSYNREFKQSDKFQGLIDFGKQLTQFRIFYIKNNTEVYINDEQQYDDAINNENVREFFLIDDNIKSEIYLDIFMKMLFANDLCCNSNEYDCVICSNQKYLQPDNYRKIVQECLQEMLQTEEFQKLCQKLFQKNVYKVDLFLEQFSKISKTKKSNNPITYQPSSQINYIQPYQQNQQECIKIIIPSKTNYIISLVRYSNTQPTQQQTPQSQIIPSNQQDQISGSQFKPTSEIITPINNNNINQSSKIEQQSQIQQPSKPKEINPIIITNSQQDFSIQYHREDNKILEFYPDSPATIEILIINNGRKRWPYGVYIMQIRMYPKNRIFVQQLQPNEKKLVKLQFRTRLSLETYNYEWALFYKDDYDREMRIGQIYTTTFKLKDLGYEKKIQKTAQIIIQKKLSKLSKDEIIEEVIKILQIQPDLNMQQIINEFEK